MDLSPGQPADQTGDKPERKILIVEGNVTTARTVFVSLEARGYKPCVAQMAARALTAVNEWRPDAVLLDLGLPDASSLEVLHFLHRWNDIPMLIVSARHDEAGKINALNEGADDYAAKPFSMGELLARLRSTMQRASKVVVEEVPEVISADGHPMVDLTKRQVFVANEPVHLTLREWDILVYLVQYRGELVTKLELLKAVQGDQYEKETNYLRIYIFQLHHKIEPQQVHNKYLRVEVGVGYRMVLDEGQQPAACPSLLARLHASARPAPDPVPSPSLRFHDTYVTSCHLHGWHEVTQVS